LVLVLDFVFVLGTSGPASFVVVFILADRGRSGGSFLRPPRLVGCNFLCGFERQLSLGRVGACGLGCFSGCRCRRDAGRGRRPAHHGCIRDGPARLLVGLLGGQSPSHRNCAANAIASLAASPLADSGTAAFLSAAVAVRAAALFLWRNLAAGFVYGILAAFRVRRVFVFFHHGALSTAQVAVEVGAQHLCLKEKLKRRLDGLHLVAQFKNIHVILEELNQRSPIEVMSQPRNYNNNKIKEWFLESGV
jgi:hypothetical protein